MGRQYPLQFQCSHPGCQERVTYSYGTRRDRESSFELKHYRNGGWKCTRHYAPNEVLGADNLETRWESTSRESEHGGVYFGNSGFVSGPGFKAFAKDFPVGTKLIVTTRIELPAQPTTKERT